MRTTIRIITLLLGIFFAFSCSSGKKLAEQINIVPFDTSGIREGSIVYGLPRTVLTVIVEAERTIEIPGPYSQFAGDLLGLDNVIKDKSESWSIENVTIVNHDELDPSEFYLIGSNTGFQTNALVLKKEGLILDLNPGSFGLKAGQERNGEPGNSFYNYSDLGSDEYYRTESDTAYRRVNIDSTFIRIPYVVEKRKRLATDQLAEKAAKRLMELRDGKHLILTGEANVFPQSEAAINEINRLEKEYTELFTGKRIKETRKFSYEIIPDKKMIGHSTLLFNFSELQGPAKGENKGVIPVNIDFTPEQKTKNLTMVNNNQAETATPVYDKLYYRIPEVVNVKISMGSEILSISRRLIYQFGKVIQLPENYVIGKNP
jgi:hypothetical protein